MVGIGLQMGIVVFWGAFEFCWVMKVSKVFMRAFVGVLLHVYLFNRIFLGGSLAETGSKTGFPLHRHLP